MTKSYRKTKNGTCKVTFELPKDVGAESASIVGDFNNWDGRATPMKRKRDGSFSAAVSLEAGKEYRFRYLLDDTRWENDWGADSYVPNQFGTEDSVVRT
jgi:1,4-alpha-glucan branching enzyme